MPRFRLETCPCEACGGTGGAAQQALVWAHATPWAVTCPDHGQVFISMHEYLRQRRLGLYECVLCDLPATFDSANFLEAHEALAADDEDFEQEE